MRSRITGRHRRVGVARCQELARTARSRCSAGRARCRSSCRRRRAPRGWKSGATRGRHAAHDPALAVAVVVQVRGVDQRPPAGLEGGAGRQAVLVEQQPAQEEHVEHALLETVDRHRELVDVLRARRRRTACRRSARPHQAVAQNTKLCSVAIAFTLPASTSRRVAEQAVPVQRDPRRMRRRSRSAG